MSVMLLGWGLIFGSYVAVLATMVLGEIQILIDFNSLSENGMFQSVNFILTSYDYCWSWINFSIVGSFFVRKKESGSVQNALNIGNWLSMHFNTYCLLFRC